MLGASWSAVLDFGLGSLEIVLVLVVTFLLGRFTKTLPWLLVLMGFFFVRGGERIYVAFEGRDPTGITAAFDGAVILLLALLLVGLPRTVRALDLLDRETRRRADEYDRALRDYRVLARHRLANPLTVIDGAIATLEARPDLDADVRNELLKTVREASERLQGVVLEPQAVGAEERGLDGRPGLQTR